MTCISEEIFGTPYLKLQENNQNENLHLSSIVLITSRNHELTLIAVNMTPKTTIYEILIHVGCICENAILRQFYVIESDMMSFI